MLLRKFILGISKDPGATSFGLVGVHVTLNKMLMPELLDRILISTRLCAAIVRDPTEVRIAGQTKSKFFYHADGNPDGPNYIYRQL